MAASDMALLASLPCRGFQRLGTGGRYRRGASIARSAPCASHLNHALLSDAAGGGISACSTRQKKKRKRARAGLALIDTFSLAVCDSYLRCGGGAARRALSLPIRTSR